VSIFIHRNTKKVSSCFLVFSCLSKWDITFAWRWRTGSHTRTRSISYCEKTCSKKNVSM